MSQSDQVFTIAPLTNVGLCVSALERVMRRTLGLPGIVEFHGPSGYGKSTAAAHACTRLRAYYVAVQSNWTRKAFLLAVLRDMGIAPAKTMPEMVAQIAEQLTLSNRPLVIDEADLLVDKEGGANLIKDLYESSMGSIMLIGEELLPSKIKRWERLDGRVLDWVPAQPVTVADARLLTKIYANGIEVADDLLSLLVEKAEGSVRRVIVNLDNIREEAKKVGWQKVDRTTWGERPLFTGKAPDVRCKARSSARSKV